MLPFREVWLADFEFQAGDGERPRPVCLVAREFLTGREIRLWRDELHRRARSPFPTDRSVLFVAFYASAEIGCFLALNWATPEAVLDLFTEHRAESNGLPNGCGNGLLGALAWHGLDSIAAEEKENMRQLIMSGGPWAAEDRAAIMDYCASDVDALARLLPRMLPAILARGDNPRQGLGQALQRGRYMRSVAKMEWTGIPVDVDLLRRLRGHWDQLIAAVVEDLAVEYPVFEGTSFRQDLFAQYLAAHNIAWPRLESGRPDLCDATFRELAKLHPQRIGPIREVRATLSELRLNELAVGTDGRNRTLLSPFRARTGRNQPSNSRCIYGPAKWVRSLITPPAGRALAYVDFAAQEIAIAACLSGDDGMWEDYQGDPYIGFGKRAALLPQSGSRWTHQTERDLLKSVFLGLGYGMTERGLALRLGVPLERARQLLQAHRRAYPTFWAWSDASVDRAQLSGRITSVFGWPLAVRAGDNARSVRNFPAQANGNEMLRLACIFATEVGLDICVPVHDALLLEADAGEIDAAVAELQTHMCRASELVLGRGRQCRTDVKIVRPGERFDDERGVVMFRRIQRLLERLEGPQTSHPERRGAYSGGPK